VGKVILPSTIGGLFATRFHQIGSRSALNTSRNVPCGIEASRWDAAEGWLARGEVPRLPAARLEHPSRAATELVP
jgi:hypothetical protein